MYFFSRKSLLWVICVTFLFAVRLSADTVTFAQFQESGRGGNDFSFINNGTSAVLETKDPKTGSSSIPVTFSFLGFATDQLPADLQGPQVAHMSLYIKTTQHVSTSGHLFEQNLYSQNASGLPNYGTIVFTRDTPDKELHQSDLLTVSFDAIAGGLDGIRLGQAANLSADNESNLGNGQSDYVQFSSSYLNFASGSDEVLALSFSSANPCFSIYKNVTASHHGCIVSGTALLNFLHSFTAAGAGTFASDPAPASVFAVPEPASASLLLLGGPALLWPLRRRRNERA